MYEVIYMKADYEPWWMFDGWDEMVRSRRYFGELAEAAAYAHSLMEEMRPRFKKERSKHRTFTAFWNPGERTYCDGCDEDLQLYHGIFILSGEKPVPFLDE
ncbi:MULTISPECIES: DUF1033 family protein [Sporosarcina]|uniref:DUF1033 family protein n=1 Tax=Sporosarcina TaxID=1569 RepID=UPI00058BA7CB|nr:MULTISPECIES: DUF1033 family protein [Sporosarcina]WJY28251.1 DUF1033 family protein [Sporosarcina sp. 0.2-SM1T-5]